jgi:hypothetical protein
MVDFPYRAFMIDDREIAAFASSPAAVASYRAIQDSALNLNPQATVDAQASADQAAIDAAAAQGSADAAASVAASKIDEATADTLYVKRDTSPAWVNPTGTLTRATYATYTAPVISAVPTQAEVQALADHVQILSRALAAVITDGRASHLLT